MVVKDQEGDQGGQIDYDQENQYPENKSVFYEKVHGIDVNDC